MQDLILKAEEVINFLRQHSQDISSIKAYEAALLGYKIALDFYKAPFLGSKAKKLVEEAVKINPQNPIALIEKANVLYFSPPLFGGSKTEAIKYYEKAAILMEKDSSYSYKNWRYINLLVFMYQVYLEENKKEQAEKLKNKIETIEPNFNFQWIKNIKR
ncbi:MAG: hypothetical protein ACK44H_05680 [Candidatus Kryptonium sp.]